MTDDRPFPNSVLLTVANLKQSLKFYRDKLGFRLQSCHPNEKKPVWASMLLGQQVVMLGESMPAEQCKEMGMSKDEIALVKKDNKAFASKPHGVGVAIYLQIDDVDSYAKAAKKKRLTFVTPLKSQFYGIRDFTVSDPDGYRLVFFSQIAMEMPEGQCEAATNAANNQEFAAGA